MYYIDLLREYQTLKYPITGKDKTEIALWCNKLLFQFPLDLCKQKK